MELKDFVAETIVEICQGVTDAQARVQDIGARVNPAMHGSGNRTMVDFDVEVTTREGTATSSKLGIFVAPLAAGTQGQSESRRDSVARIKFAVPIVMPVTDGRTRGVYKGLSETGS
jgi:hypothetical protein